MELLLLEKKLHNSQETERLGKRELNNPRSGTSAGDALEQPQLQQPLLHITAQLPSPYPTVLQQLLLALQVSSTAPREADPLLLRQGSEALHDSPFPKPQLRGSRDCWTLEADQV